MNYRVKILQEAEEDIFDIYRYIFCSDSPNHADYVFEKLEEAITSLQQLPEPGRTPPELEWIGVKNYREIHFKPYRIIYDIESANVFIHGVLDGRRDLQQLLEKRFLR